MTYEQLVEVLSQFARENGLPGVIGARHLQRLARGERGTGRSQPAARPATRQLLAAFFRVPFDELLRPPQPAAELARRAGGSLLVAGPADSRGLAGAAAQQSLEFLATVQHDGVVEHLTRELRRIATDYVHQAPVPLFSDLLVLRNTAFALLRDRACPRRSRELFVAGGVACVLLAQASHNMGASSAARAQATTAAACAQEADHFDLRAWVCGTLALIEESSDYQRAAALARQGQCYARGQESHLRLAALEARTLARSGQRDGCADAIGRARRARDLPSRPGPLGDYGGVLTFPPAKQAYYAASTLALAGEHRQAERAACEAIEIYESGPPAQRSYGDEALARIVVAVARAGRGELDGTAPVLEPVFRLSAAQRIQQVAGGLCELRSELLRPEYAGSREAGELIARVEAFAAPYSSDEAVGSPA